MLWRISQIYAINRPVKKAQLVLRLRQRRPRKRGRPKTGNAGVSHLRREALSRREPVHVTLRTVGGVPGLRRQRSVAAIEEAFRQARIRLGMRIVHYSIQGNHLHLLVEAEDKESLSKAMQGLAIRVAKTLNRLFRRAGQVWADRYHSHVLRSGREVANALRYVLGNFARHTGGAFIDGFSSVRFLGLVADEAPVATPRTWLLRVGWL